MKSLLHWLRWWVQWVKVGYILDYAKQVDIGIVDGEVNKHHPGTTVQPKIILREKTNTPKFTSLLKTKITN